jgi:F420H(2)-dependent quinone reductase
MTDNVRLSSSTFVARQAKRYEESGGTQGTTLSGAPCLLLDYQGRSTGQWWRTVLVYAEQDGCFLVVASNGGSDEDPKWVASLQANPQVNLRVGPRRFPAVADRLSAAEKERVWPDLIKHFPTWDSYRSRTTRDLPVFRFTPLPE